MESMGNVILSGYYGFDNVGDEAVMYAIIKTLKEEIGNNIKITVLSNEPDKTASAYDVGAVDRWKFKQIISALKKSDLLISGGGSLLQDATGWKSIPYYLSVVFLAKLLGKKVVFYAQGIGPVSINFNRLLIKWIGNKVDYISVRDHQSKEELMNMGIKKKAIDVTVDPVLRLHVTPEEKTKDHKKRLGVYLRNWKVEAQFFQYVKEILHWFYQNGWEVVFIPMHYPHDIEVAKKISKELPTSIVYEGDHFPENILKLTSTMDFVIGMRLHALIMAAAAEVPFLGLSYDPKVKNFVDTIGIGKAIDIHHINIEEVFTYLETTLHHLEELKEDVKLRKKQLLKGKNKPVEFIKTLMK